MNNLEFVTHKLLSANQMDADRKIHAWNQIYRETACSGLDSLLSSMLINQSIVEKTPVLEFIHYLQEKSSFYFSQEVCESILKYCAISYYSQQNQNLKKGIHFEILINMLLQAKVLENQLINLLIECKVELKEMNTTTNLVVLQGLLSGVLAYSQGTKSQPKITNLNKKFILEKVEQFLGFEIMKLTSQKESQMFFSFFVVVCHIARLYLVIGECYVTNYKVPQNVIDLLLKLAKTGIKKHLVDQTEVIFALLKELIINNIRKVSEEKNWISDESQIHFLQCENVNKFWRRYLQKIIIQEGQIKFYEDLAFKFFEALRRPLSPDDDFLEKLRVAENLQILVGNRLVYAKANSNFRTIIQLIKENPQDRSPFPLLNILSLMILRCTKDMNEKFLETKIVLSTLNQLTQKFDRTRNENIQILEDDLLVLKEDTIIILIIIRLCPEYLFKQNYLSSVARFFLYLIEKYAAADTLLEYLEEIMKKYKERQQAHHFNEQVLQLIDQILNYLLNCEGKIVNGQGFNSLLLCLYQITLILPNFKQMLKLVSILSDKNINELCPAAEKCLKLIKPAEPSQHFCLMIEKIIQLVAIQLKIQCFGLVMILWEKYEGVVFFDNCMSKYEEKIKLLLKYGMSQYQEIQYLKYRIMKFRRITSTQNHFEVQQLINNQMKNIGIGLDDYRTIITQIYTVLEIDQVDCYGITQNKWSHTVPYVQIILDALNIILTRDKISPNEKFYKVHGIMKELLRLIESSFGLQGDIEERKEVEIWKKFYLLELNYKSLANQKMSNEECYKQIEFSFYQLEQCLLQRCGIDPQKRDHPRRRQGFEIEQVQKKRMLRESIGPHDQEKLRHLQLASMNALLFWK